jgi:hypothetical protein
MKDLDTLQEALRETAGPARAGDDLDFAAIMKRGRRLRLRRRLAAAGGSLCVAAAVYGVVTGATHLTRPSPAPVRPAGPARIFTTVPSPAGTGTHAPPVLPSPAPRPMGTDKQPTRTATTAPEATGKPPRPSALPGSPTGSP